MGGMKELFGDKPFRGFEQNLPTPPAAKAFDGATYEPARDHVSLNGQLLKVYNVMMTGEWFTLQQIAQRIGGHNTEAAISARIRDFRKTKYGGHKVERRSVGRLFMYRLVL